MSDSEKTGQSSLAPLPLQSPPRDWVAQIRQISVPVWARALALILALAVLLPGIVLIWGGWLGCAEFMKDWLGVRIVCHENWIAQGIEIVVAAFVPVVVILYLVFAETGMRSLARRTNELLEKIVPQALRSTEGTDSTYPDGMRSCVVATRSHVAGSIAAHSIREGQRYLLLIARRGLPADFLWNPAAKLHFAWDLRAFAYSVIHDGHSLLRS